MISSRRHFFRLMSGSALAAAGATVTEAQAAPAKLDVAAAQRYFAATKGEALLVKQHGKVLHESFANGGKRGEARRIYSGTKGFWGVAAMAAVDDGVISLDEKVSATIPEWDEEKGNITIEQLLDFTCGLERGLVLHQDGLKNRGQMALDRPLVAKPGERFIYGPSALQVFHEVLKKKLAKRKGAESPTRYLERRVLRPLGLGPQRYIPDAKGNPLLAAGFMMSPMQWSRMGDLLLADGQPVLKKGSLETLLEGSSANAAYSFGFWNNRAAGRLGAREIDIENHLNVPWNRQNWSRVCVAKGVPKDMITCIGSSYQRLYVIPSQGLVVVRQGINARYSDGTFLRTLLGA